MSDPLVNPENGISGYLDGLFGSGTSSSLGDIAKQVLINKYLPEQNQPVPTNYAATETAIAEQAASSPDMTNTYIKYGLYGLAGVALVSLAIYAVKA